MGISVYVYIDLTVEPDDQGLRELHVVPLTINNPHAENGLPIPTTWR